MLEDRPHTEAILIEVCIVAVAAMWLLAVLLMVWMSFGNGPDEAEGWAILVSAAAAAYTVVIAMGRGRRRLIRQIETEVQLVRDELRQATKPATAMRAVPHPPLHD